MKLEEVKRKYKDQWVLAEVLKEDVKMHKPESLRVIKASKNRSEMEEAMKKTKVKHLAVYYTGEVPKKGYALAF